MKLLVTGGAGFIGSHYVRTALSGGYEALADADLVVLDNLTYAGNLSNLEPVWNNPRLTFVNGDICDAELVMGLLSDVDEVVHFAAESHVDRSIDNADDFMRTNVLGTHTLLQAALAKQVDLFLHVSTDEVYGSISEGSWPESHLLDPSSPYSASKAASDLIVRSYFKTFHLPVNVTRAANTYGPYQHIEKAIPRFITRMLAGQKAPVYGDGKNIREWLHVDDHCRAIELVRRRGVRGEIYNIKGQVELTNLDIVREIGKALGLDGDLIEFVPDRLGHDDRYSVDGRKLATELGFAPLVDISQGIKSTVTFYAENRKWWQTLQ